MSQSGDNNGCFCLCVLPGLLKQICFFPPFQCFQQVVLKTKNQNPHLLATFKKLSYSQLWKGRCMKISTSEFVKLIMKSHNLARPLLKSWERFQIFVSKFQGALSSLNIPLTGRQQGRRGAICSLPFSPLSRKVKTENDLWMEGTTAAFSFQKDFTFPSDCVHNVLFFPFSKYVQE